MKRKSNLKRSKKRKKRLNLNWVEQVWKTEAKNAYPQINLFQNHHHSSTLMLIIRKNFSTIAKKNQIPAITSLITLNLTINSRVLDLALKIIQITKTQSTQRFSVSRSIISKIWLLTDNITRMGNNYYLIIAV